MCNGTISALKLPERAREVLVKKVDGTPNYIAPEQAKFRVNRGIDIWALGCVRLLSFHP